MSERHPEDLPWNDVAADSDTLAADPEPDPAEVVGDGGEEEDAAAHRVPDPYEKYHAESLDQRLAEEEPEAALTGDAGEDDVEADDEVDGLSAEEDAVHVTTRP